jgi:predicted nucleic acid-binding protein
VTPIFADTSLFIALMDRSDAYHSRAVTLSSTTRRPFLTTSAIVLELGAHFCKGAERRHFMRLCDLLSDDFVRMAHVDIALQRRGVDLFLRRADKDWSLADCISFIVMEDTDVRDAASTDEHFEQARFNALLRHPLSGDS